MSKRYRPAWPCNQIREPTHVLSQPVLRGDSATGQDLAIAFFGLRRWSPLVQQQSAADIPRQSQAASLLFLPTLRPFRVTEFHPLRVLRRRDRLRAARRKLVRPRLGVSLDPCRGSAT